jgi:GntR family transcriptional regulator
LKIKTHPKNVNMDKNGDRRRPLYQEVTDILAEIISNMEPGSFLPSEPDLAKELGVSRATLREAMRPFEQRGFVIRRQGVGTYVTSPPPLIESGLEVMDSLLTIADRMDLTIEMGMCEVTERFPGLDEAEILGISVSSPLVQISRTIVTEGRPLAYLVDSVPKEILPQAWLEKGFSGSVIDLLSREYEHELAYERTEISAISADRRLAAIMRIQRGTALLFMETYLFTTQGRAIDHEYSYFLPGGFKFHVMRRKQKSL